jgi:hypothetical protein
MTAPNDAEPPFLLDGHHVVRYAVLDESKPPPAHFHLVAGGVPIGLDVVKRLVVAEDLVKGRIFLMHCDADWMTVTAETFEDADAAQASAESRYAGVPMRWSHYRELTEQERHEVQVTRDFLRELAAEFPDD